MLKGRVRDQEHQPVVAVMNTASAGRGRMRWQAVLMAARGRPHRHMAEDLAVSVRTRPRGLHRVHRPGLSGLPIRWASGRAAQIPAARVPAILAGVRQGPAGGGLDRAPWTSGALASHLDHVQGLTVSATTMRLCCQRHGVRPSRPTAQALQANPAAPESARHALEGLKQSAGGGTGRAQSS